MNYALEGQKWGAPTFGTAGGEVTWAVDGTVPTSYVPIFESAFAAWALVGNITFTQAASTSVSVINIDFNYIDGLNQTLGEATYYYSDATMLSATITIDAGEGWQWVGDEVLSAGGSDLFILALHEIGHAIGLDHYNASPAIMNSVLSPSLTGFTQSDIDGIRAIYGPAPVSFKVGPGGDDVLIGGPGAEHFDGGSGFDFASYVASPSGVFARLDLGVGAFGDAELDAYASIEGLIGSEYADILVGNAEGNIIYGGDGVDQLTGGAGADVLDGQAGFDFTRYDLAGSGVIVRLDQGGGTAGDALWDTYVSIEGAVGSEHADVIVGSAQGNYFFGVGGNDWIYGFGGYDEIYGGGGADAFVFRPSDLSSGVSTVRDFSAAEGDAVFLEGVDPAGVSAYQSGADVVIAAVGGGGVVLAGTTLGQLEGHLLFT
jgi:Ca2+-binding RTX toxin-like protein